MQTKYWLRRSICLLVIKISIIASALCADGGEHVSAKIYHLIIGNKEYIAQYQIVYNDTNSNVLHFSPILIQDAILKKSMGAAESAPIYLQESYYDMGCKLLVSFPEGAFSFEKKDGSKTLAGINGIYYYDNKTDKLKLVDDGFITANAIIMDQSTFEAYLKKIINQQKL